MATDTGAPTPENGDLPPGVVEDLLAAPRRRALLRHLAERDEPVPLTDLAAAVGAEEAGTAVEDLPAAERRSVREDIYEHHLPKLTATDVVAYDSMRGTLSLRAPQVRERVA